MNLFQDRLAEAQAQARAVRREIDSFIVSHPEALGDTYAEVMGNLRQLGELGIVLRVDPDIEKKFKEQERIKR